MEQAVMTMKEVAAYLRVHRGTVQRMLNRHQIPAFRVGSDWRFNRESIDRWRLNGGALSLDAIRARVNRE